MSQYKLPSGARLDVTPLSHEEAWGVTQAVLGVVKALDVDVSGMDLKAIVAQDVLKFKGPVCGLLASDAVLTVTKQCLEKSTYNDVRVDGNTFEPIKARGDFLFAAFYALKENISPFFETLLSFFETK